MSFPPDTTIPEPTAPAVSLEAGEGGDAPAVAAEERPPIPARPPLKGKLALAIGASVAFHIAVAAAVFLTPAGEALSRMIAGAHADGPAAAGDAAADKTAGSASATPEKAVAVTLVEPQKPTPPAKPQPPPPPKAEETPAVPPKPATAPQPPTPPVKAPSAILTANAPDAADAAPPAPPEPPAPAAPKDEAANPQAAAVPTPTPRPTPPPPVREAQNRPSRPGGAIDSRSGVAGGTDAGHAASSASVTRNGTGSGNAAVSNYPGTIASKLNRSLRYPASAAARKLRGEAKVQFTIEASGTVGEVRVVATSGSDVLDQAAIATVKRAAPFPPIPDAADRRQWPFTVTLAFGK